MKAPSALPIDRPGATLPVADRPIPTASSRLTPVLVADRPPAAAPSERAAVGVRDTFALMPPCSAEGIA